jgi:ABC-type uncharacterized transport system substrate-binding protein
MQSVPRVPAVRPWRARVSIAASAALISLLGLWAEARAEDTVLVVRPAVVGAEAQLFEQLQQATQASLRTSNKFSIEVTVTERGSNEGFQAQLERYRPDTVITLGRRALQVVRDTNYQGRIVAGAVDLRLNEPQQNTIVVGLFPDPRRIFAKTKQVLPATRRIVAVTTPRRWREIRDLADRAARDERLTLMTHEADSVGERAATYLNIIRYGNPETDVLWIIDNEAAFSSDVLPRIVELAWSKQFPVISNFVDHVGKGALLASYPDARRLGATLGRIGANGDHNSRVEPLQDLMFAANLRTARHLLPLVDIKQLERADLMLGQR